MWTLHSLPTAPRSGFLEASPRLLLSASPRLLLSAPHSACGHRELRRRTPLASSPAVCSDHHGVPCTHWDQQAAARPSLSASPPSLLHVFPPSLPVCTCRSWAEHLGSTCVRAQHAASPRLARAPLCHGICSRSRVLGVVSCPSVYRLHTPRPLLSHRQRPHSSQVPLLLRPALFPGAGTAAGGDVLRPRLRHRVPPRPQRRLLWPRLPAAGLGRARFRDDCRDGGRADELRDRLEANRPAGQLLRCACKHPFETRGQRALGSVRCLLSRESSRVPRERWDRAHHDLPLSPCSVPPGPPRGSAGSVLPLRPTRVRTARGRRSASVAGSSTSSAQNGWARSWP